MGASVVELADMVEAVLDRHPGGMSDALLESAEWRTVQHRAKDILVELTLKGQPSLAAQVDREFDRLAAALVDVAEAVAAADVPAVRRLQLARQGLRATLLSLGRFAEEIEKQYQERRPGRKGLRGPERMTLEQAWRDMTIIQAWYVVQKGNARQPVRAKMRKPQFAAKHKVSVEELNAMLAWYRKYRNQGSFPKDPRSVSQGELAKLFA